MLWNVILEASGGRVQGRPKAFLSPFPVEVASWVRGVCIPGPAMHSQTLQRSLGLSFRRIDASFTLARGHGIPTRDDALYTRRI